MRAMASTTIGLKHSNSSSSSSAHHNNICSNNKRIHVTFHHDGAIAQTPVVGAKKRDVEAFLHAVWSEFGPLAAITNAQHPSAPHYHRGYAHGMITYQTHKDAIFALAGLEDPIQVQVAIQDAVGANPVRAALARQLFVEDSRGVAITAVWADES